MGIQDIIEWAEGKAAIQTLLLSGSLAGRGPTDHLSDYDIAIFGQPFDFIATDDWLKEISSYWVCIWDSFVVDNHTIPTRLVVFDDTCKVDFSFHPPELLSHMVKSGHLPEGYRVGYQVLLDKAGVAVHLPEPSFQGFVLPLPTRREYEKNENEFWFEVYHVAKYLYREDLWTAKWRDHATKEWLLQILQWEQAISLGWQFSPKDYGKGMKRWLNEVAWNRLHTCFGHFDRQDSWAALENTAQLYRETAMKVATLLGYPYNQRLDQHLTQFIKKLKESSVS